MVRRSGRVVGNAGAVELDELPHDPMATEHLGDGQHEVGGGSALGQLAEEPEADDTREQHRQRLPEHDGFDLDAADSPGQHTKAVDHRGVGVGAQADVGESPSFFGGDHPCQVFDVDLVHDPGAGRNHGEVAQFLSPPLEEPISLRIAPVLDLDVPAQRRPRGSRTRRRSPSGRCQLGGDQRIDRFRVLTHGRKGVPHGREVDQGRDPVGVVQEDPRRAQVDRPLMVGALTPAQDQLDLLRGDPAAVLVPQQVLQHDAKL